MVAYAPMRTGQQSPLKFDPTAENALLSRRSSRDLRTGSPPMDNHETASTVLSNAVIGWLADEALLDSEPAALFGELCRRLRGVGMPVLRAQVGFRILHPLYDASTMNWNVARGVAVEHFSP